MSLLASLEAARNVYGSLTRFGVHTALEQGLDAEIVPARCQPEDARQDPDAHACSSRGSSGLAGPHRCADVHRGEDRENVSLEQTDQDVEGHQRHRHEKARERDENRDDQVP
jgi:hypothetical protein